MTRAGQTPTIDRMMIPEGHRWNRLPWVSAAVGAVAVAISLLLGRARPEQFYFSWLTAFVFFLSIALGGMFFVLSHFLTGARWSVVVRRVAENTMGTLWVFAPLFVPILLGMHELFHWSHAEVVAHDPLLQQKGWYLNNGFFVARALFCFAVWAALSLWLLGCSRRQDHTRDPGLTVRMRQVSAPGMFLFAVTSSLAAVDWIMSLDPHWYSTMIGVYYFAGSLVAVFAFMSIFTVAMRRAGLARDAITTEHLHDLGKLLFAFTVFWAYIAFSQYFLIWYGNIPEETVFYKQRAVGSWRTVSLLLAYGHFAVPFLFLMSRHVKRRSGTLVLGSAWMLLMHYVDLNWLIMPTLHPEGFRLTPLDLTTLVGVGGLFLAALLLWMRGRALIPTGDPRLRESLGFENA